MKFVIKYIIYVSAGIFLLIHGSCKNNPVYPYSFREKSIIGEVTDEEGKPISDVDIHYIIYLEKKLDVCVNEVYLKYNLKTSKEITIRIHNKHNTVITGTFRGVEKPGEHTFKRGLSDFTNGIYMYEIEGKKASRKEIVKKGLFLVFNKELYQMIGLNPLMQSTRYGIFQLTYSDLGIGEKISMLIEGQHKDLCISDSIDLILYKENYTPHLESFKINPNKTIKKTFILSKENKIGI